MGLLWQANSLKDFTRLEIVRPEQAKDLGGGQFRVEVKFGDMVPGYSDTRSLWDISQLAFREGDECAFGLSVMLPADWIGWFPKNDELASWPVRGIHGGSLMEFHHAPNDGNWNALRPGSAPFYLIANDKNFGCYLLEADPASSNFGGLRPQATWTLKPITRGEFVDFVVHVKWSTDPNKGYIEIFADGQQVVPRFASRTLYPNTFVYPQIGLYRRGFIGDPSLKWGQKSSTGIVYPPGFFPATGSRVFPRDDGYPQSAQFKNLRIGVTKEDVMATTTPAPAPGTTTTTAPANFDSTQPSVNPNAGAKQLMATRDALMAQVSAAQAQIDAINALLSKGPWAP